MTDETYQTMDDLLERRSYARMSGDNEEADRLSEEIERRAREDWERNN